MKKGAGFLHIVLFSCTLLARDPAWIFNNGPDASKIAVGHGDLCTEAGLTKLIPTGTDLTLTVPLDKKDAFPADKRPFFALRYKYRTSIQQAGLFFTTDTLTGLSDKSYSPFPVVGDNTWRKAIVDMRAFNHKNWSGTITSFRFDPINPSDTDSVCEISRFGFFPSEEQAQQFLAAADDAPDFSRMTHFMAPLQRVIVPGGSLSEGFDRADFMLRSTVIENPSDKTIVRFQPRAATGEACVIPLCQTTRGGFTCFVARKPGQYRLANSDVFLDDIAALERQVRLAIEFIAARELIGAAEAHAFRPADPISDADWSRAVMMLRDYAIDLTARGKPASRAGAAVVLRTAIETLMGTSIESPYTHEYITRDRIRIGAWVNPNPEAIGDTFIETFRSAGFDWIIAHGVLAGGDYRRNLLSACDRYGVELILGDGCFRNAAIATAEYLDHPCFAGTYITDEPGTDQYKELAEICHAYRRETGNKLPYINLLPMYANAAQLKYGADAAAIAYYDPDPDVYKKYCDDFCRMFDLPYICTDIYPLNWADGRRTTYKNYCESINVIATSARDYGKDFWCCIQTFAWEPGKRTPTESEFRWQSYCMLSFGCKGLLCWTYCGYQPEFPSLVTREGKRSNAWYDAAGVFKEIRCISDAFVRYRNLGAMRHNGRGDTPYLRFSHPLERFAAIQRLECEQPLLIGCFAAKEGPGSAFTVVNMSELEAVETAEVKIWLAGATVVAWPHGRRVVLSADTDGCYRLTLASGEGIFVEVE